jgi:hypothetical protein
MTYEQVHDPDAQKTDIREQLLGTEKELEAAGFIVGDLEDMPETDPEFVPDPMGRLASGGGACSVPGDLMEMFPAGRFGSLLALVEIFGLDRPLPARCDPRTTL